MIKYRVKTKTGWEWREKPLKLDNNSKKHMARWTEMRKNVRTNKVKS